MLIEALRVHPAITNVRIREERSDPLYVVKLDRDKTQVYDVKAETLARYVGATRSRGTVSSLRLRDGDNITEVSFVIREAEGSTTDQVKDLTIFTANRGTVPLGELAIFSKSRQQSHIRRTDRQSSLEVSYYFLPGTNITELSEDIKRLSRSLPNPAGVILEFQGETQRIDERRAQFIFTILSGAVLVYVVMAAVFESFWVPFIILLTNPLMLIGIVWGLDIAGLPLDDLAAFGIILLVGLAVNNGIVMMDRTLELQRRGSTRTRAVFEASLTRLRPILMTWMTTVLGLAPLALVGETDDQWRPVAVVIIGGLTSATVLTLIVLPCFYLIGDDFVRWARPWFLRALKVAFETFEGIGNAVMHPWQAIRGHRPVAPGLRSLLWEIFSLIAGAALAVLRIIWHLPADLFHAIHPTPPPPAAAPDTHSTALIAPDWPSPLLRVRNLQVWFPPRGFRALLRWLPARLRRTLRIPSDGVQALHGVSLDLDHGLFGLLGPNGAGKTTLMRAIAGLQTTDRGSVRIAGMLQRDDPALLAPLIGYLPQDQGWYGWMTLREYLEFFALVWGRTIDRAIALQGSDGPLASLLASLAPLNTAEQRAAAIERVAHEVNLHAELDRRLDTFSGGMRQRAGIARLLLQAPPIIIVDEPTAKLDPVERVKVRLLLSRLARRRLVIFSTHLVEDLDQSCDLIGIMVQGRIVYLGSPDDLSTTVAAQLWEAHAHDNAQLDSLRANAATAGAMVVDQQVRGGKTILRAIGTSCPDGWIPVPVEPTLEQSLLSTLEAHHHGTLTR
jgi:ABC-type multidrug transport system ATPase subunit